MGRRPSRGQVDRRLVGVDFTGLGDDPLDELSLLAGADTPDDLQRRLRIEVEKEVGEILRITAPGDAFDLIELLRLREFPIVPVAGLGPGYDGSGAVVELITLILRARESGRRGVIASDGSQPHEVIPELHDRSKRLLRLASFRHQYWTLFHGSSALARVAATYQSYFVGVRGLQYDSVERFHDEALFDRPEIDQLLQQHLGFTYSDFRAVRDAIQDRYSSVLTSLRDETGEIARRTHAEKREPTAEEIEIFQRSMIDFMFLPGERAAFTAADLVPQVHRDEATVAAVLDAFSLNFDNSRSPVDCAMDFLHGKNPVWSARLLRSGTSYLMTSDEIGSDSLRSVVEAALKDDAKSWKRYDRVRAGVSESVVVAAISQLLPGSTQYTNLKYYAPSATVDMHSLGRDCSDPREVGEIAEGDALFLLQDVAVCVEVKARAVAEAARRGDIARLEVETKSIIGAAAGQARRLETLIGSNGGVWLENRTWLDLSDIREVRTVVAGLDYFGPLSIALGDLVEALLLDGSSLPWVVSLHDLQVISRTLDRPAEFLLYLRRRSDSGVAAHFSGADELDLFMLFMNGGLYVEPDPDQVHRDHPQTPAVRPRDRRRRSDSAVPTVVGTHTDPLDEWFYWEEGTSPYEADKPTFNIEREAAEIVDFLAKHRTPGWLRFGADLLGLSGDALASLIRDIDALVDLTRADGGYHTLSHGFAGLWGYPSLFVATTTKADLEAAAGRLQDYMTAKKHQLQSDRSLGLLLDEHGLIRSVLYLNDPPGEDPELDELVKELQLQPTWKRTSGRALATPRQPHNRRKQRKRRR